MRAGLIDRSSRDNQWSTWWLLIGSVCRCWSTTLTGPEYPKAENFAVHRKSQHKLQFLGNWKDSSSRIFFVRLLRKKIDLLTFQIFPKNMHIYPLFPWKWRFSTLGIELTATVYACTNPVAVTAGVRLSPCCVGALCKIFCKIFKN